jgi:EmrB/QacA subfamily drug resistance transporter
MSLTPSVTRQLDPRRWKVLALLGLVQFMVMLDSTIVNPALPTIHRDLHFSTGGLAWVVNGYTLMAGGFLIVGGRVADLFGRKRMFVVGTVLFAVASGLSGLAQDSTMLICSRFAQGLGEAIAAPAALSLVVLAFTDPKERAKAVGMWGGIAGLGATLGVVISGMIVDWIGWRWIFLVNLPVAAVVVFVVPRMVKESRMAADRHVDYMGAVFITGGLTLIVDGLLQASSHNWGSSTVVIPLAIGGVLLVAFVGSQVFGNRPLIPKRFFHNRTRVSANVATMFAGAGFFGLFFSLTLYMQEVLHYSALKTGLAWGPFGAMLFVGLGVSQKLLPKVGVKVALIASFLISALGLLLLSRINVHGDYPGQILPGMLVMAFGQSISFIGLLNSALHRLGPADAGLGSATQNTSQQLGGSLGLAILVSIGLRHIASQVAHGTSQALAATHGYSLIIEIAAAVMAAGAVMVALTFERVDFIPPDKAALEVAEAGVGEVEIETPGGGLAIATLTDTRTLPDAKEGAS